MRFCPSTTPSTSRLGTALGAAFITFINGYPRLPRQSRELGVAEYANGLWPDSCVLMGFSSTQITMAASPVKFKAQPPQQLKLKTRGLSQELPAPLLPIYFPSTSDSRANQRKPDQLPRPAMWGALLPGSQGPQPSHTNHLLRGHSWKPPLLATTRLFPCRCLPACLPA